MKNIFYSFIVSLLLIVVTGFAVGNFTTKPLVHKANSNSAVILELFTSQGCSSCPPADAILGTYANNPNIIPISFHVDYWNRLGWKDPFSQSQFSERQRAYSSVFGNNSIYTPQLVINGKYELVGSKASEIKDIIKEESKSLSTYKIEIDSITNQNNQLKVRISAEQNKNADVVNIALIKKKEITNIKRGENSGVKLTNYNIVIEFQSIPVELINSKEVLFSFSENWIPSDYMLVAFLQNSVGGKIVAGTKNELTLLKQKGM
jgi:hypothetical protein